MDKYIRVKNCNCISDATIEIVEKSLNIKYGSNGTGKSTISEAIYAQANNETDRLKDFKPYGSNDNSQPTVDNPYFHVVKVFNEDYVNSYLFQGDEFLDDSFQVFLKSDKCDSLAAQIERMIYIIEGIHKIKRVFKKKRADILMVKSLDRLTVNMSCYEELDGWFRMQNVKVFGYDYDDFVETDEHTCLMLTRRKWSFRKFVKSIILKVKGMW